MKFTTIDKVKVGDMIYLRGSDSIISLSLIREKGPAKYHKPYIEYDIEGIEMKSTGRSGLISTTIDTSVEFLAEG